MAIEQDTKAINNLISQILLSAIKVNASDIHIEPAAKTIEVRFRIDGEFHHFKSIAKDILQTFISRIKVMSDLKTDQKQVPQDGSFSTQFKDKEINFRVSTFPFIHGEKVVMRIISNELKINDISRVGLLPNVLPIVERNLNSSYGMILIVGPTGSGKTSTLMSAISHYNASKKNISTIEDPVEYKIPGINHAAVRTDLGFGFAEAAKALLRQDPDVIMVGETRDKSTVKTLVEASLSGHITLSSMHTNSATSTIGRLRYFDIENVLIASSLRMVISQRLGRQICPHCREKYPVPNQYSYLIETEILPHIKDKKLQDIHFYRGKGCEKCNFLGFIGRIGFFEVLDITPSIEELIIKNSPIQDIQEKAVKEGMITIKHDALIKVIMGDTTIEEAIKVIA